MKISLRNRVQLIGVVVGNPEIRFTEGDGKHARLSIAVHDKYINAKGEKVTETQWHNLIAVGKTAELIEKYVYKGAEIAVEGKLQNRDYIAKDGTKKYITEVQVNDILLLNPKPKK